MPITPNTAFGIDGYRKPFFSRTGDFPFYLNPPGTAHAGFGDASDIHDACNMLGMNYEEDGASVRKLGIGEGFVLTRMSHFHDPFLVKFPKVNVDKGLSFNWF